MKNGLIFVESTEYLNVGNIYEVTLVVRTTSPVPINKKNYSQVRTMYRKSAMLSQATVSHSTQNLPIMPTEFQIV